MDINPLQIFPSDPHGPVTVAQRGANTFRVYKWMEEPALSTAIAAAVRAPHRKWVCCAKRVPTPAIYEPARASFTIRRASSTMLSRWAWSLKLSA